MQHQHSYFGTMPLVIANTTISDPPTHLADFLQNFPNFKAVSEKLCSQKAVVVGPSQLVYVGQREMAATTPTDKAIKILGTEDATTCHITVLRNAGSGATCLCHLDGCSTEAAIQEMVRLVVMLSPDHKDDRLELSLIGGFTDNRGNSEELSLSILGVLCSMKETIHLSTVCITGLNTVMRKGMPWPVIYGVGVNVGSGEIFPATFPHKGPDMALRSARHFAGGDEVLNIYEPENCQLIIGPFHYDRMRDVERWCKAPDHLIRQYLSTSPEQEPKDFEASVRESLIQIRDYPDPLVSVFTNGQGRKYDKQEDGTWKLVEHKGS